jgi:hypothetical protein
MSTLGIKVKTLRHPKLENRIKITDISYRTNYDFRLMTLKSHQNKGKKSFSTNIIMLS